MRASVTRLEKGQNDNAVNARSDGLRSILTNRSNWFKEGSAEYESFAKSRETALNLLKQKDVDGLINMARGVFTSNSNEVLRFSNRIKERIQPAITRYTGDVPCHQHFGYAILYNGHYLCLMPIVNLLTVDCHDEPNDNDKHQMSEPTSFETVYGFTFRDERKALPVFIALSRQDAIDAALAASYEVYCLPCDWSLPLVCYRRRTLDFAKA